MNSERPNIQRVELNKFVEQLFCPFCGECVISESEVTPCSHTLFVATEEGFEFRSQIFDEAKGTSLEPGESDDDDEGEDEDDGDEGASYDSFTDDLVIPNAVKFAIYVPAPSGMGAYVGFALS